MILQVGPFCSACLRFGKTLSAEENQPFEHHSKQHQDVGLDKLCGLQQSQNVRSDHSMILLKSTLFDDKMYSLVQHTHITPLYVDDLQ